MFTLPRRMSRRYTSRVATMRTDPDFWITAWDAGAEELFGWTADEAIGRPAWEVVPGDGNRLERMQSLRSPGEWQGVLVTVDKRKRLVAVESDVKAERVEGRIVGYVGVHRELASPDIYQTAK
jgi:PAS domain S-box-containing protein